MALNRLGAFLAWPVERVPLRGLAPRIWEFRHMMTAYDAAYVALAEVTGRPLVTCDAKLLSGGHRAEVRVWPERCGGAAVLTGWGEAARPAPVLHSG